MYVKVLYDHSAKKGLLSGHGFSCLIDGKVLFDAGGDRMGLVENMDRMMVSSDYIDGIVISHDHWDHTEGLWELLKRKKGVKVFVGPSFGETLQRGIKEASGKIVLVDHTLKIFNKIYVVKEIPFEYKEHQLTEQALVVYGDKGVSVITGCAHPGIVDMLAKIKKDLGIKVFYMVFGGFHLDGMSREEIRSVITGLVDIGVQKVGPTHCSGERARRMFKSRFGENYIAVRAGHVIQL